MNETEGFLNKHRGKGAFLDANLLLVYAVGRYNRRLLRTFHHTKQYEEDFEWIERLVIKWFAKIHTTPNILTEVSNLGGKLGSSFFDELKAVIAPLVETHCPSLTGTEDKKFREVGLADSVILAVAAKNPSVVLTADLDLYHILRARQIDAININYMRQVRWAIGSRQMR
jgi:hypothetical protein